jgi:hypothetical protein
MGICIHCLQAKSIAASKCPSCHEYTGILESMWWSSFHFVGKVFVTFFLGFLLYQCVAAVGDEPKTEQVTK